MDNLVIRFTPQEFEYVLQALAQRPFAEVNGLLQNLVQQAKSQAPVQEAA